MKLGMPCALTITFDVDTFSTTMHILFFFLISSSHFTITYSTYDFE